VDTLISQAPGLIDKAGVVGLALFVLIMTLVGLDRGWWYTGRDVRQRDGQWDSRFQDMRHERDEMRHERDEWKLLALTQRSTAERMAGVMEQEIRPRDRGGAM
jgi:hypothetical protein